MPNANKTICIILAVITLAVFVGYCFPNAAGSENQAMVSIFQPDESAQYSVIDRMTSPKPSLKVWLEYFVTYGYYHYGFPFFALSSLPVYGVRWMSQYQNWPLVMVALRQTISLLPTLLALLILVYMFDQFKSYRSVVLYLGLLSVPAVVANSLWWHPDGLTLLLSVLTLFFLWKDNGALGKFFRWAAVFVGILIATKLIGIYFFISIVPILLWKVKIKQLTSKRAVGHFFTFFGIAVAAFILANPFVLVPSALYKYLGTVYLQLTAVSKGYGVIYETGLKAAGPTIREGFGSAVFLLTSFLTLVYGLFKGNKRYLHFLILVWFIPLTFTVLFTTHFKYQYWLPGAIPMLASLVVLLPEKPVWNRETKFQRFSRVLLLAVVALQLAAFAVQDVHTINTQIHRAENNPSINFFEKSYAVLQPIRGEVVKVYYDYRIYVPLDTMYWRSSTSYDLLTYETIREGNFDILLLLQQRLYDYLNPKVEGIDPGQLKIAREFYSDANAGRLKGYSLLYRDDFGLLFLKTSLCQQYFPPDACP